MQLIMFDVWPFDTGAHLYIVAGTCFTATECILKLKHLFKAPAKKKKHYCQAENVAHLEK